MWKRHFSHLVVKCVLNTPKKNQKISNIRRKKTLTFLLVLVLDSEIPKLSQKKANPIQITGFMDNPISLM